MKDILQGFDLQLDILKCHCVAIQPTTAYFKSCDKTVWRKWCLTTIWSQLALILSPVLFPLSVFSGTWLRLCCCLPLAEWLYPNVSSGGERFAHSQCPLCLTCLFPPCVFLLPLSVLSAKPQSPKLPNRHARLSSFVEVTADGLTSETKKTGKRTGHALELQWNEDLTLWANYSSSILLLLHHAVLFKMGLGQLMMLFCSGIFSLTRCMTYSWVCHD